MFVANQNEIMGDAPQSIERRLILPTMDGMSFGDLLYIAGEVDAYSREVQAMLEEKREERIAELKAQVEADKARVAETQAALAALCPPTSKLGNPSKPKYQDPDRPENTWAGKGKQPGWLKEKLEAGASLEDFLIDQPTTLSAADDSGF